MREQILDLRQERASIWEQAKALNEKVIAEKRDFTADEQEQYDRMIADMDKKKAQIDRMEEALKIDDEMSASKGGEQFRGQPGGQRSGDPRASAEYRAAFERLITSGPNALTPAEVKMMQADDDQGGGYWVTPQQMVMELIKDIDNAAVVRQFARGFQLRTAKSLGAPTLTEDFDDAEWTTELKTGSNDDLKFGKRELRPHPVAKRSKISNTLLRLTANGAEAILRERLAYVFSITLEKAYMTGDGNQKPLGLFTASNDGISTARDVSTGNTSTKIGADGLIEALYSLKEGYQQNARWIFHRDAIKEIRKLKDGEGQYLWRPGIEGGAPDRILEKPFVMSEYAPNTFTAGKYVGLIGDLRYYWYVDALDFAIQRLVELYAETNQTGFIGRYEGDGMPVLEKAFARVKLA